MHPDMASEQAYFDHALEQREIARSTMSKGLELVADPKSAVELNHKLQATANVDPDEAVAFGRIDDGDGPPMYIGRAAI